MQAPPLPAAPLPAAPSLTPVSPLERERLSHHLPRTAASQATPQAHHLQAAGAEEAARSRVCTGQKRKQKEKQSRAWDRTGQKQKVTQRGVTCMGQEADSREQT